MAKNSQFGFHTNQDRIEQMAVSDTYDIDLQFKYTFENFFHPFVGELIQKLNKESLQGLLDADFHEDLKTPFFDNFYKSLNTRLVDVEYFDKEIDVSEGGPYANYNWELLFHIPLTIAVHLSKNQRFAEAQRWFHYIFDPTNYDKSKPAAERYWKFLAFRDGNDVTQIDQLLALLSKPAGELNEGELKLKENLLAGYAEIMANPFRPHAVARVRHVSYQYSVVMKYLDNLIAWGDSLFRQDTIESINEATQLYVLAANILGERPQRIPKTGKTRSKTFAQLKAQGLDQMGNALVELEGAFPLNLSLPQTQDVDPDAVGPLFGIGPTLYFCIPRNEKLLGYWDTVADRLFKIRHCMNIGGMVRQLAMFDPPIDPGMLVKAVAAGIDIGSIISGLNQPIGPTRSLFTIQKALELTAEVRGLGTAFLSAIEKGEGERIALLRQKHEIKIQQMTQDVRFLQWKQAQESTESLVASRASALERYRFYQRLLGLTPDEKTVPDSLPLDRRELTEENFDEAYSELVGQYDKDIQAPAFGPLNLVDGKSPTNQSGATSQGSLFLNTNENVDLNVHAPASRDLMLKSTDNDVVSKIFVTIPDLVIDIHPFGVGVDGRIPIGELFTRFHSILSSLQNTEARIHDSKGSSATKTASYERRVDDWTLQNNLAANELMQIGRQIISSLISEQLAYRDYLNVKKQIEQSQEVDQFLHEKFTNEELYAWMQGEISRLYYEYYRFAFDTARKAEQSMKRELMRPEVDATDYVKFNYWDSGRKGLLSGEALYLDLKRMEMAYHENNKREYELTKHASLRQLNPPALLSLKATGTCEVTLPEWMFDLDNPGHYMRRIKNVSLSIPSVTGPYTSVSCTLSLQKSSLRKSALLKDDEYTRQGSEDDRFIDYFGTIQSIVTSSGINDSGMFETNLREERLLPFEGAGAESTWRLELSGAFQQFDYNTISDVILHMQYTARQGGEQLRKKAVLHIEELVGQAHAAGLALLFSLRNDLSNEWHRFVTADEGDFVTIIKRDHFPYITQGKTITLDAIQLFAIQNDQLASVTPQVLNEAATLEDFSDKLKDKGEFELSITPDTEQVLVHEQHANVFVLIKYSLGV